MFGLFRSSAKKERIEAKQTYEMVIDVVSRIRTADLATSKRVTKISAMSAVSSTFLKNLAGITEIAKKQLPAHCHERPFMLSSPQFLREEAERKFTAADKVAEKVGFAPFVESGSDYLLGAFILCHSWDITDQTSAEDLRQGNYSVGIWRNKLKDAISDFLVEGGADSSAISVIKTL